METKEIELRGAVVELGQRIYRRGWFAASDGNISVRLGDGRFLVTPSGSHKGTLNPADLLIVDETGVAVSGGRPSTEIAMHLAVYSLRRDVDAVVHAHPAVCIALSLAGISLASNLLPEVILSVGAIPTVPYATPGTSEVADEVRRYVDRFDAMILERHGSLTVGATLEEAYAKLERMEHAAEIVALARQLGPVRPMSSTQVERLQAAATALGFPVRPLAE